MQASKRGESGPNGKVGPGKGKTPIEPEVLSPGPSGFGSNRASSTYAETRPTQESMDTIDLDSVSFDRGDTEKAWEAAARAAAAAAAEAGEQNPFERPELEEEDQVAAPPPSVSFSSVEDTIDLQGEDLKDQETKAKEAAEDSKGSIGRTLPKILIIGGVLLAFAMRGNILWTPIGALLGMIVSWVFPAQKYNDIKAAELRRKEEQRQAREQKMEELREQGAPSRTADLYETTAESSRWMPIFLDTWWPVIEEYVSNNVVGGLQSILDQEVPPAVTLQVSEFQLGSAAPQCTNVQALYRPSDGRMEVFQMDVSMRCRDLSIIIRGSAPVIGNLTVQMNKFDLNGTVQMWMLPEERCVVMGFRNRPQLQVGMQIEIAQQKVEMDAYRLLASPIESIIYASLAKLVEGRRRVLIPLEISPPVPGVAVGAEVGVTLVGCSGLPGASELGRYQVTVSNYDLKISRKSTIKRSATGSPEWKSQSFKLPVHDKFARFDAEVTDVHTGQSLGSAIFNVASLSDGCAAFWATGPDGRALAKRWKPKTAPWRVGIPLELPDSGTVVQGAEVTLDLSVLGFNYRQDDKPKSTTFRTPGPRTVIVRVIEAHNVGATRAGARFVQVKYNNIAKDTQLVANSNHPNWNRTFVFTENTSPQTRKIRLKVLSAASLAGIEKDLGYAYLNLDSLHEDKPMDEWLELGGTQRGKLRVVAEVLPGLADSKLVKERVKVTKWQNEEELSLRVEVVAARKLAASDLDGSADSYVKLSYGALGCQTQVVPQTLSPTFYHKCVLPLGGKSESLKVECLNFDPLRGIDDSLGSASIDLGKLLEQESREYQVKARLFNASPDLFTGDGEVLLRISRVGSFENAEAKEKAAGLNGAAVM